MALDSAFYNKLLNISANLKMKPEDILNVMAVESGINPSAHNKNGDASGLIQFMPSTLKGLGFRGTHEDFRKLSGAQQLDYVEKFIRNMIRINGKPFSSAAQYYVGNLVPAALKIPGVRAEDPNTIILSRNPTQAHIPGVDINTEIKFYKSNSGLDYDKDGNITYGDIRNILKGASHGNSFKGAINNLRNYTGYSMNGKSVEKTNNIDNILNNYLQQIIASEKQNKKLYKQYLPINCLTIKVISEDFTNSVEFARILCTALDEDLLSKSFIHSDNSNIEIECRIPGPEKECFNAVDQLTKILSKTFREATMKIGGINIKTSMLFNKKSNLNPISLKIADRQYRRFLNKFTQGK